MAKSSVDAAIDKLKAQIADVQRAIDALTGVQEPEAEPKARKPRGKNKAKPGLPAEEGL